jgi:hypothetical protein
MSVRDNPLAERQYTDIMLLIGADHVTAAAGGDALLLVPALWILGVVVFVALKLHSR